MSKNLLTKRQKEVLRYRDRGLTQQAIADILHTTKSNICTIEKSAMVNIQRAKETLEIFATRDAQYICTIPAGTDLFDSVALIVREADKAGIAISDDPLALINRIRGGNPGKIHGRYVMDDIGVYLRDDRELFF